VRALLDTHTFLWWVTDDERLSRRARRVIAQGSNEIFFSAASAWEMSIKSTLGRIELPQDLERYIPDQLERNAFQALPVRIEHALRVAALPELHRDPFDRLLVAQAVVEGLAILSKDRRLAGYPARVIW
jgi:PIN domain nuclease of toxin-antitoxin system